MKIVFFGTSRFGIPALSALRNSPHELLAVYTAPDKPQGRHLKVTPSPVKSWALDHQIPCFNFAKTDANALLPALKNWNADVFVVISFGVILPKAILEIPKTTCLNVHASLLPRYRGPAPIQWAVLNGESQTGVTVMRMIERLDAGDVILQKQAAIEAEDDQPALEEKLSQLGADALFEALEQLQRGRAVFTPQNESLATYARKIKKEDGHLRWDGVPAASIYNHVRALRDWPGSYVFYKGKRIILLKTTLVDRAQTVQTSPGTLLEVNGTDGILVAATPGLVRVLELKAEGHKALGAEEFLRGFPLKTGERFE